MKHGSAYFFQKLTRATEFIWSFFLSKQLSYSTPQKMRFARAKCAPGSGRNTVSDAFRHCFWSALPARDIGYASALRYTNAHEAFAGNFGCEKIMDLHNNAVGLRISRFGGSDELLMLN